MWVCHTGGVVFKKTLFGGVEVAIPAYNNFILLLKVYY